MRNNSTLTIAAVLAALTVAACGGDTIEFPDSIMCELPPQPAPETQISDATYDVALVDGYSLGVYTLPLPEYEPGDQVYEMFSIEARRMRDGISIHPDKIVTRVLHWNPETGTQSTPAVSIFSEFEIFSSDQWNDPNQDIRFDENGEAVYLFPRGTEMDDYFTLRVYARLKSDLPLGHYTVELDTIGFVDDEEEPLRIMAGYNPVYQFAVVEDKIDYPDRTCHGHRCCDEGTEYNEFSMTCQPITPATGCERPLVVYSQFGDAILIQAGNELSIPLDLEVVCGSAATFRELDVLFEGLIDYTTQFESIRVDFPDGQGAIHTDFGVGKVPFRGLNFTVYANQESREPDARIWVTLKTSSQGGSISSAWMSVNYAEVEDTEGNRIEPPPFRVIQPFGTIAN